MISLPKEVLIAFNILNSNGFQAFITGGSLRDFLMGRVPKDMDIATNATPPVVESLFAKFPQNKGGMKYGCIAISIGSLPIDITTYRVDGSYSDSRRPQQVSFTSNIMEDLSRRDFTINAMAYHPSAGLVDPHGGLSDLKSSLIRTVQDSDESFKNDALRIIRGLRFVSTLGLDLEPNTLKAMYRQCGYIKKLSRYRLFDEFSRAILGSYFHTLSALAMPLLSHVWPNIPFSKPSCSIWNFQQDLICHNLLLSKDLSPHLPLRISNFLQILDSSLIPSTANELASHNFISFFNLENSLKKKISTLLSHYSQPLEVSPSFIRKLIIEISPSLFFDLLELKSLNLVASPLNCPLTPSELDEIKSIARKILSSDYYFDLSSLAVNGKDMLHMGLTGSEIGSYLNTLVDMVLSDKIENNRGTLLSFVKSQVSSSCHNEMQNNKSR